VQQLGLERRVHFLGFQENPYPAIANSDLLLVPSLYEGFGLVVAEAAALGVPAVVSDVPALCEVAALTGGVVVPAQDAEAMAEACRQVMLNRHHERRQVSEFGVDTVIDRYRKQLESVVPR
jgi:glycosyltransferase involved in cell wall biosynthesis